MNSEHAVIQSTKHVQQSHTLQHTPPWHTLPWFNPGGYFLLTLKVAMQWTPRLILFTWATSILCCHIILQRSRKVWRYNSPCHLRLFLPLFFTLNPKQSWKAPLYLVKSSHFTLNAVCGTHREGKWQSTQICYVFIYRVLLPSDRW